MHVTRIQRKRPGKAAPSTPAPGPLPPGEPAPATPRPARASPPTTGKTLSARAVGPLTRLTIQPSAGAEQEDSDDSDEGGLHEHDEKASRPPGQAKERPAGVHEVDPADDDAMGRELESLFRQARRDVSTPKARGVDADRSGMRSAAQVERAKLIATVKAMSPPERAALFRSITDSRDITPEAASTDNKKRCGDEMIRRDRQLSELWRTASDDEAWDWIEALLHAPCKDGKATGGACLDDASHHLAARCLATMAKADRWRGASDRFVPMLVAACAVPEGASAALLARQHALLRDMFRRLPQQDAQRVLMLAVNPCMTAPDEAPPGAVALLMMAATPRLIEPLARRIPEWQQSVDRQLSRYRTSPGDGPTPPSQARKQDFRRHLDHALAALGRPACTDLVAYSGALGASHHLPHDERVAAASHPALRDDPWTWLDNRVAGLAQRCQDLEGEALAKLRATLLDAGCKLPEGPCRSSAIRNLAAMFWSTYPPGDKPHCAEELLQASIEARQAGLAGLGALCHRLHLDSLTMQSLWAPQAQPAGPVNPRTPGDAPVPPAAPVHGGPAVPGADEPSAGLAELSEQVRWHERQLGLPALSSTSIPFMRERLAALSRQYAERQGR